MYFFKYIYSALFFLIINLFLLVGWREQSLVFAVDLACWCVSCYLLQDRLFVCHHSTKIMRVTTITIAQCLSALQDRITPVIPHLYVSCAYPHKQIQTASCRPTDVHFVVRVLVWLWFVLAILFGASCHYFARRRTFTCSCFGLVWLVLPGWLFLANGCGSCCHFVWCFLPLFC